MSPNPPDSETESRWGRQSSPPAQDAIAPTDIAPIADRAIAEGRNLTDTGYGQNTAEEGRRDSRAGHVIGGGLRLTIRLDAILERLTARRTRDAWLQSKGVLLFPRRKKADTPNDQTLL